MSATEWAVIAALAAGFMILLLVGLRYSVRWRARRSLIRQRAVEPGGRFIEAEAALGRGDPWRAIALIGIPSDLAAKSDVRLREAVLLTAAYSTIGADGKATDAFLVAAQRLLEDDVQKIERLRPSEAAIVRQWLPRIPNEDTIDRIHTLHPELQLATSERTGGQRVSDAIELLEELATRIVHDARNAQADTRRWHTWNNLLGVFAAAAAAFAAVTAGFFEPSGLQKLVVVIPALISAALSATLTTLKPSEQEQEAAVRESSLVDLGQQMEMFQRLDLDAATGDELQREVINEVYERAARANLRPVSIPLLDAGRARLANHSV
jgi:hypothetical protein